MMPPTEEVDPPTGDVIPYPSQMLAISGGRFLLPTGRIMPAGVGSLRYGDPCDVQDNTRWYWEDRAAKAGYTLEELLAE